MDRGLLARYGFLVGLAACLRLASAESPPEPPADGAAPAGAVDDAARAPAVQRPRVHRHLNSTQLIDERVRALAHALDLDATQQAGVRRILVQERQKVVALRTGGDNHDAVAASHAIVQRAREDIRDLLTEEQRRKYILDAPEDQLGPSHADVDYWLQVSRSQQPSGGPVDRPQMAP